MTLFRLASMTKPITAVAVLMLVEAGRITLEDPVSRFLPDFQALQVQTQPGHTVPEVRPPTIRDLLRHTSGLSYRFMNVPGIVEAYEWLGVDDGLAAPDLTLAENLRRLALTWWPMLLKQPRISCWFCCVKSCDCEADERMLLG